MIAVSPTHWLSLKSFDENKVSRDHGKFSEKPGAAGETKSADTDPDSDPIASLPGGTAPHAEMDETTLRRRKKDVHRLHVIYNSLFAAAREADFHGEKARVLGRLLSDLRNEESATAGALRVKTSKQKIGFTPAQIRDGAIKPGMKVIPIGQARKGNVSSPTVLDVIGERSGIVTVRYPDGHEGMLHYSKIAPAEQAREQLEKGHFDRRLELAEGKDPPEPEREKGAAVVPGGRRKGFLPPCPTAWLRSKTFDPDQPRDEDGKFAQQAGSSGAGKKPRQSEASGKKAPFTGRIADKLGRARCYKDGKPVPCHTLDDADSVAATRANARRILTDPASATPEDLLDLYKTMRGLTVPELKQVQAEFSIKHKGRLKPARVDALVGYARMAALSSPTPAEPAPSVPHIGSDGKITDQYRADHPHAKRDPNPALPDATRPPIASKETAEFINNYTWGYDGPLNKALRKTGLPPPGPFGSGETGKPPKDGPKMFAAIQEAFASARPFRPPVRVERGIDVLAAVLGKLEKSARKALDSGGAAVMPGFVSTTTDEGGGFGGNVQFKIAAVHGLDTLPYSRFPQEKELLLNHDSRYTVKSVEWSGSGSDRTLHIELEQLPPGEGGEPVSKLG